MSESSQGEAGKRVPAPGLGFAPFIVSTSLDKPDPMTRKFIRSHVMRGKNAGKSRRRQGQPALTAAESEKSGRVRHPASPDKGETCGKEKETWALMSPRKIASELTLYRYAETVKPYMFDLIFQGNISAPSSTSLRPHSPC